MTRDELPDLPPPIYELGDYIYGSLNRLQQGEIVKIYPPVTKYQIVLYDVVRPDGARFQIDYDHAVLCGGLARNQREALVEWFKAREAGK